MPEALSILAGRSGAIDKVIQGLEGAYQNADSDKTRAELEKKACHYIVDALSTVVKDIENVGGEVSFKLLRYLHEYTQTYIHSFSCYVYLHYFGFYQCIDRNSHSSGGHRN